MNNRIPQTETQQMTEWQGKRSIAVVSACMTSNGSPTFAINEVAVTHDEALNGIHYDLADAELLNHGYEEPFTHFDEFEAPTFLHPAVRQHLVQRH